MIGSVTLVLASSTTPVRADAPATPSTVAPTAVTPSPVTPSPVAPSPAPPSAGLAHTSPFEGVTRPAAFVEFGVALGGEVVASTGGLCPGGTRVPCIFGSGGGLTTRVGYRFPSPLYVGGAYELSKQDANNLLRLAILQQLRFEARYLLDSVSRHAPFVTAGAGVAGYGNEWSIDTWGPTAFVGVGIETQLSRTSIFDVSLVYRPVRFRGWTDRAGLHRDGGVVSFVAFELALGQRTPIE